MANAFSDYSYRQFLFAQLWFLISLSAFKTANCLVATVRWQTHQLTGSTRFIKCRLPGVPLTRVVLVGHGFRQTPDAMLRELAAEAGLKYLRLGSCAKLTDTSVRQILTKCNDLVVLELGDCELLTPEILKAYTESCNKTCLGIWRCVGVRPEMLTDKMGGSGKIDFEDSLASWAAEYRR